MTEAYAIKGPDGIAIDECKVISFRIRNAKALDPIMVVIEDICPGNGCLIIECFGKAWSAYWGGMGDRRIVDFLKSCSADYIASKLTNGRISKTDAAYLNRIVIAVKESLDCVPVTISEKGEAEALLKDIRSACAYELPLAVLERIDAYLSRGRG